MISIVLVASALMPNAGLAAAVSLAIIFISQLVDGLLGTYWPISPLKLPVYAAAWFENGPDMSDFWWSVSLTFILIMLLLVIGIFISAKKAASTKV